MEPSGETKPSRPMFALINARTVTFTARVWMAILEGGEIQAD